jgi:phosphoglycolate/pyridoxal phosphate phosphatase family enzyme
MASASGAATAPIEGLASLPPSALLAWLASLSTFLCDCDGVLWRADSGVPGVAHTVAALRARGKRVLFVTNNSTKSRRDYVAKLRSAAGIDCAAEDIVSSAFAAAEYCRREGVSKKAYVLGGSGLVDELRLAVPGLGVLGPDDFAKEFAFGALRPETHLDPDVQAVVIGFDARFSYYKLATAALYLRYQPGCKFVATNRDASYPDAHCLVPGGGSLVAALETGSGRAPDVVAGKPSLQMLDLIDGGALDRARTCMVGDRLDTDIAFGNAGGLRATLLVLTGISSLAEAGTAAGPLRPTCALASFGDLGALIEKAEAAAAQGSGP